MRNASKPAHPDPQLTAIFEWISGQAFRAEANRIASV